MAGNTIIIPLIYNCEGYDANGVLGKGIGNVTVSATGAWGGYTCTDTVASFNITATGQNLVGHVIPTTIASISVRATGVTHILPKANAKVIWSKNGSFDFTIDDDAEGSEAGEGQMAWEGWCYQGKKLSNSIISYGQDGICQLKRFSDAPKMPWGGGNKKIISQGLLSKNSVCGTDDVHFFITKDYKFYKLTGDGIEKIDHNKQLDVLSNKTVMTIDESMGIVHICDGTYGFVYADALGKGPANITGMGWKDGTFYSIGPSTIITPPMECTSSIFDFDTRSVKHLYRVDFDMKVSGTLKAAIDYRYWGSSWYSSPWTEADSQGRVHISIAGVEFRAKWKLMAWEAATVNGITVYANIEGEV